MLESAINPSGSEAARGFTDPLAVHSVIRMRIMLALAITAVIALYPPFGDNRLVLALWIGTAAVAMNVIGLWALERTGRPPGFLAITDISLLLLAIFVVPESMAVASVIAAGIVTLLVLWHGVRATLVFAIIYEIGLAGVAILHRPPWWAATMAAFAIATIGAAVGLARMVRSGADARDRYVSMVNGLDAVVWESDAENRIQFLSGNVEEVLGTQPATFAHPGFYYSRIHPDDLPTLEVSRHSQHHGELSEAHIRIRDDDGNYRWIQERQKVSRNADGTIRLRRGLVVNETARWVAEAGLRRYLDFIEGIPVALVVMHLTDREDPTSFEVSSANPAADALVPTEAGARLVDLVELNEQWLADLADVALGGAPMERPFVTLPGTDAVFTLRAVHLPEQHVGLTFEDITKRARLAESFRHQALHDELTGLPNRAHFRERLDSVTSGENPERAALLLVDLNQFKEINDTLGHDYGDRLLRGFAQRLSTKLRGCDLIARIGGDEFAILVTGDPGESGAIEVADRLLDLCDSRFDVGEFGFRIGASVGIALSPDHATDAESLLRKADTAMYWAKGSGGGWSMYAPAHDDRDLRRLELMSDLRDAIAGGAMDVHYQPRIRLADRRVIGLEALVRWHHPRYGLLPPDEFIELAEVSGCIGELTEFVIERSIAQTTAILERHNLVLSVNLSARTIYDPRLSTWVDTPATRAAIDAGRLCFEITESELMEDPTRSLGELELFRAIGIRFSVDDFGTGYSSLSYLRELPIDEVKIDRSFMSDLHSDDTIVRAVIDLGHNLGLKVVAEGVEDVATEDHLRELGCDSAQGFLWGRAVPIEEVLVHFPDHMFVDLSN